MVMMTMAMTMMMMMIMMMMSYGDSCRLIDVCYYMDMKSLT